MERKPEDQEQRPGVRSEPEGGQQDQSQGAKAEPSRSVRGEPESGQQDQSGGAKTEPSRAVKTP